MVHQRYDLRRERDGTWSVIDIFTGQPAEVDGVMVMMLDIAAACDWADLLNVQDFRKRMPFFVPR